MHWLPTRKFFSAHEEAGDVCRRVADTVLKKRWGRPKMQDGKLDVWFGRLHGDGPDLCVQSGEGCGGSSTRGFVLGFFTGGHPHSGAQGFEQSFLKEMETRGFDISTLRFSIRKKADVKS